MVLEQSALWGASQKASVERLVLEGVVWKVEEKHQLRGGLVQLCYCSWLIWLRNQSLKRNYKSEVIGQRSV